MSGPRGTDERLSFGLAGQHQVENAGLATIALRELQALGFTVPDQALRDGLAHVHWPGRFEIVHRSPDVVVDGAHNVDSARRLAETLREEYTGRRLTLVLGIARDKDIPGMVRQLASLAGKVVATASRSPRAASPDTILAAIEDIAPEIPRERSDSVAKALSRLLASAGPDDVVCVAGSLYAVAEAREALGVAEPADFEQELLYR